jgi:hypothetical protein
MLNRVRHVSCVRCVVLSPLRDGLFGDILQHHVHVVVVPLQHTRHLLVALHDDPQPTADALVDQLCTHDTRPHDRERRASAAELQAARRDTSARVPGVLTEREEL